MSTITLAEEPVVTFNGEGVEVGKPIILVRTAGCNIGKNCPFECDTRYSWDEAYSDMWNTWDVDVLLAYLVNLAGEYKIDTVMITGGEPLVQKKAVLQLARGLRDYQLTTHLETNGTIGLRDKEVWLFDYVYISPKNPEWVADVWKERVSSAMWWFFKIVVKSVEDIKFWERHVFDEWDIPRNKVLWMPEGKTREEILESWRKIRHYLLFKGYWFSPREQIMLGYV